MVCEHWKRCGDCHSPALVAGLREVEESLRRDVERLTAERDIHALNVKLANERAVAAEAERDAALARCSEYAAGWDAHSARAIDAERERDAAYAASLRSDEVHSEAMRAVRARAEKAEAERDAARAQVERLRGVLRDVEWRGHRGWGPPCCVSCEGFDPRRIGSYEGYLKVQRLTGHMPDCELIAALADATVRNDDPDAPNERR